MTDDERLEILLMKFAAEQIQITAKFFIKRNFHISCDCMSLRKKILAEIAKLEEK